MPALVLAQTMRLTGVKASFEAAAKTVGYPRQSINVPKTPPSHSHGKAALIQALLKARNSALLISPEAITNSRCFHGFDASSRTTSDAELSSRNPSLPSLTAQLPREPRRAGCDLLKRPPA